MIQQRPTDMMMDGPIMEGKWFNPKTGDTFTVKDSFFEDNQFKVVTTDGRTLGYNQIQNYIKDCSKDGRQSKNINKETGIKKDNKLPNAVLDMLEPTSTEPDKPISNTSSDIYNDYILPEDNDIINGKKIFQNNNSAIEKKLQSDINDHAIIERALKDKIELDIDVACKWSYIPTKELDLLTEVMGISFSDIAMYFAKQIDIEKIAEKLVSMIEIDLKKKYEKSKKDISIDAPKPKTNTTTKKVSKIVKDNSNVQ